MKRVLILTLMLTLTIVSFTLSNSIKISTYGLMQAESMQDCKNCEDQTANSVCKDECILPCSGGVLSVFAPMISSDHNVLMINDTIHRGTRTAILRGKTIAPDPSPPKMSL